MYLRDTYLVVKGNKRLFAKFYNFMIGVSFPKIKT